MVTRRPWRRPWLLLLALVASGALAAETPPPGAPAFKGVVSVPWLLVPVTVRNDLGRYVDDLEKRDFRLSIDGKPVDIQAVDRGDDAPVSVVFLQDLSGSMANGGKLEGSQRAIRAFLSQAREGDEFSLATFAGEQLAVEVPFTGQAQALTEAMALWEGYGTTALHDAVAWLPEISAESIVGNRLAVLITDGQDNASTLTPEQATAVVKNAQLPVYVLGLTVAHRVDADEAGEDPASYGQLLSSLAQRTGGSYFEVTTGEELDQAVAAILEDLRRRYVLAVELLAGGKRATHQVKVEVLRRGRYSISFRRGYHGTLPTKPARAGRRK